MFLKDHFEFDYENQTVKCYSSKSGKTYTLKYDSSLSTGENSKIETYTLKLVCDCKGFICRGTCRHVDELIHEVPEYKDFRKYCETVGISVDVNDKEIKDNYCRNCGNKFDDKDNYCASCGNKRK